jgi:hypothetical protein
MYLFGARRRCRSVAASARLAGAHLGFHVELQNQTSRILSINKVDAEDGGRYECHITNARFPKLTLYSRNVSVQVGR